MTAAAKYTAAEGYTTTKVPMTHLHVRAGDRRLDVFANDPYGGNLWVYAGTGDPHDARSTERGYLVPFAALYTAVRALHRKEHVRSIRKTKPKPRKKK